MIVLKTLVMMVALGLSSALPVSAPSGSIDAVIGSEKAVTPDTPFLTGSISKSFTALSVLLLAGAVIAVAGILRGASRPRGGTPSCT